MRLTMADALKRVNATRGNKWARERGLGERSAGRRKRLSSRRPAARKQIEILPALMRHPHHLNPVSAGAIDEGAGVPLGTHPFSPSPVVRGIALLEIPLKSGPCNV